MLALLVAVIEVTIPGQRLSLRNNIGLTDGFIDKEKVAWKEELKDFPNAEKIINELDAGRHVAKLFDQGSFSLAVLWACNVMEEIINAAGDGIIQTDHSKKSLFRRQNGERERIPRQLSNLGYTHRHRTCRPEEDLRVDNLGIK